MIQQFRSSTENGIFSNSKQNPKKKKKWNLNEIPHMSFVVQIQNMTLYELGLLLLIYLNFGIIIVKAINFWIFFL